MTDIENNEQLEEVVEKVVETPEESSNELDGLGLHLNDEEFEKEFSKLESKNYKKELEKPEEKIEEVTEVVDNSSGTDYKSFYEAVTSKFKANGMDMSITDPSEIIGLMQQGLNYTKKSQELSVAKRFYSTLREAGINEDDLSLLIDVHKKNPEAIAKLVNESGVNLYDVDDDAVSKYKPSTSVPTEAKLVLQDTLDSLKSHEKYEQTISTVLEWDADSQFEISNKDPNFLPELANHISNGLYDHVQGMLLRERAKGVNSPIRGMNDYQGYRYIVDYIAEYQRQQANAQSPAKPKAAANSEQRRLAAPSKGKAANTNVSGNLKNMYQMSDADFEKEFAKLG